MEPKSQTVTKNQRKKEIRRLQKGHLETFSASGPPRVKVNPEVDFTSDGQAASHFRQLFLSEHERHLRRCAVLLGEKGCWAYYYEHLEHSRIHRYQREFRQMVVTFAQRFAGRSVRTILTPT